MCKIGICRLLEPSMTVLLMLFVCLSGLFIRYEIHFTCSLNFPDINDTYLLKIRHFKTYYFYLNLSKNDQQKTILNLLLDESYHEYFRYFGNSTKKQKKKLVVVQKENQ